MLLKREKSASHVCRQPLAIDLNMFNETVGLINRQDWNHTLLLCSSSQTKWDAYSGVFLLSLPFSCVSVQKTHKYSLPFDSLPCNEWRVDLMMSCRHKQYRMSHDLLKDLADEFEWKKRLEICWYHWSIASNVLFYLWSQEHIPGHVWQCQRMRALKLKLQMNAFKHRAHSYVCARTRWLFESGDINYAHNWTKC